MSQNSEILCYLKSGQRLTPLEALRRFGCLRLSGRIYDIKKRGVNVKSESYRTKSGKYVARYFL
jgi:hypothetical protein